MVGLGFVYYVSDINQSHPTKNYLLWGKSGQNATFNLIILGLGRSWVGEFVAFSIIIFIGFPTQQHLVNRKHPNVSGQMDKFAVCVI